MKTKEKNFRIKNHKKYGLYDWLIVESIKLDIKLWCHDIDTLKFLSGSKNYSNGNLIGDMIKIKQKYWMIAFHELLNSGYRVGFANDGKFWTWRPYKNVSEKLWHYKNCLDTRIAIKN